MITKTGLSNKKFTELRLKLVKDAEFILAVANNNSSELCDIVASLRTTESSIHLKADTIWKEFEKQKKKQNKLK